MTDLDASATRMVDLAQSVYREPSERAALRCGAGDAAGLCDAIAKYLTEQHRTKRGHLSVRGQELAQIAKLCGDEIWKMRDLITVPHEDSDHDTASRSPAMEGVRG